MKWLVLILLLSASCAGTTKATIEPNKEAPVVIVQGQMAGEYVCDEYTVKWDSKRPSVWDRVLEGLLMGRLVGE